jgi:hypothetical protein
MLDAGTDVNAQGGRYGNALQAASWEGHETLLDAGVDVDAQGGEYGLQAQLRRYTAGCWGHMRRQKGTVAEE